MDKTIVFAVIAVVIGLGAILIGGINVLQRDTGGDMHSVSVVDDNGARSVTAWRE